MGRTHYEPDKRIIEEQAATIRLLTDLTKAGSWIVNFAPDGSAASVQWGDGFRRLMGYSDKSDFPDEMESFVRGIYPEDRDTVIHDMTAVVLDDSIMRTTGKISASVERTVRSGGFAAWAYWPGILKAGLCSTEALLLT